MTGEAFGARMLSKFGWKSGEGLGKDRQGAARSLAVTSQRTTEGVGFQSAQFEPWWDKLYDRTAAKFASKGTASEPATASGGAPKEKMSREKRPKKTKPEGIGSREKRSKEKRSKEEGAKEKRSKEEGAKEEGAKSTSRSASKKHSRAIDADDGRRKRRRAERASDE